MPILKKQHLNKSVLDLAYERLNNIFDQFDTVSVSFSGGKDSTICLNLTLEVARQRGRLPLDVVHWDEEAIPYQTEEYVRRTYNEKDINLRWLCVPVIHRNACSRKEPYWYPWAKESEDKWVRPLPPEAITEVPNYNGHIPTARLTIPFMAPLLYPVEKYGRTACVMGIRADESLTRYRAVSQRTTENYIIQPKEEMSLSEAVANGVDISRFPTRKLKQSGKQKSLSNNVGNFYKVYPIYDWQTADVWTAPKKFGWDYNHAYDVMEKIGMTHSAQRCAPPYGEEPLEGLWTFKECFPEIWDKMCYRVRGANTAARHALTVLYSNRSQPQKPEGMEWEEYIAYWIRKFPLKEQGMISERIQSFIKKHYEKTKDPILAKTPHPVSGISWEFLLKIAVRGDFKGRKLEPYFSKDNVKEWESRKSMYAKELADVQSTD
mgnify:FL=1